MYNYKHEDHFKQVVTFNDGTQKIYYPNSIEKKDKNIMYCKEKGYKVITTKLYPVATEKNQHNMQLIHDILFCKENRTDAEDKMLRDAEDLFGLPLPIAWVDGKTYSKYKELSGLAIQHRDNACIAAGRLDLLNYE